MTIRVARSPGDWRAVRELACRTGDAGEPIEPCRWPFFADVWVGPYERLAPGWTYVAEHEGRVVAYLTGCPDTAGFRRAYRRVFALPLLLRVIRRGERWDADVRRFVGRALGLTWGPEARLRASLAGSFEVTFPAHLHMNVETGMRQRGLGGALLGRYLADLRAVGVPGVHLYCGVDAARYYARHGFGELGRLEFRPSVWVYALARRLDGSPDFGDSG